MDKITEQLTNAVTDSQHCYRNFDLTASIPQDHLDLMIHAATEAPSKQNNSYFNLTVVSNPDIISKIHAHTVGATVRSNTTKTAAIATNSQILANLVFVYESKNFHQMSESFLEDQEVQEHDLEENSWQFNNGDNRDFVMSGFEKDKDKHLGISSGQLVLVANMLGYRTGYCTCFDSYEVKKLLNLEGTNFMLVGIGVPHPDKTRIEWMDDPDYDYMVKKREQVCVEILD